MVERSQTSTFFMRLMKRTTLLSVVLLALSACQDDPISPHFQGYGEGEFIYLSAYQAGTIETLEISRGDVVAKDQLVFTMDSTVQANQVREAEGRLEVSRHQLANLSTGKRVQEIAVLIAGQRRAIAALKLSKENLMRKIQLRKDGFSSQAGLDQAQAEFDRNKATLDELSAQIITARLTARVNEIGAAEATQQTAAVAVETAQWHLNKRRVFAPRSGRIEEVLFDVGEYLKPGQPVISLLPVDGIKVRFFVPESRLNEIHEGQTVALSCDNCPSGMTGLVSYIANEAEYTPPIIFSQPSQEKLVYMGEASPTDKTIIHPGQPVKVSILKGQP